MKKLTNVLFALFLIAASLINLIPQANAIGTNLVSNPSVETVNPTNSNLPQDWLKNKWGTNTSGFAYVNNDAHTGSRSVRTNVTSNTSGDAKWYFKPVAVQPGKTYVYSDWYKANVETHVVVEVQNTSGQMSYHWLNSPVANTSWKVFNAEFTMPTNAKSATVFHLINKTGFLQIDDSFFGQKESEPAPEPTPIPEPYPEPTPTPEPTSNFVANPSVETASGSLPQSWTSNKWGTNTTALTYENTGHTGSRSLKATISSYSSGDAKWYFNSVPATAGKTYTYSNWYKSDVQTELNAMVTMSNGSLQFIWLADVPASPGSWQKAGAQFTAPAGAVSVSIFHIISNVGYLQTDDFSMTENQPNSTTGFNRALVSLTFDDGWQSVHTNGLPLLNKYGFVSTQYLNSEPTMSGYPEYMTYQQIKDFINTGSEVAWHTRTHTDLTSLGTNAMNTELTIPSAFLSGVGQPASTFKNFASPFGAYNNTTITETMKYYRSHRSTDNGFNAKDNLDVRNIKVQNILNSTTAADVQSWVNQAVASKSWLVLVYHEVGTNNEDPTYSTSPALLDQQLNAIKQSGVTVRTVDQALNELLAQL